ncbi:hypothetical protein CEW87_10515 [Parazoarcus communis]|uniref:Glycosyl transferase family 1 domain-containing protein n=1 Tax=Parazoarcus communis TaxID=41977 RepID=A0A2U8H4L0_9RHOO|nr:glycosyltransferase [Parazoarcus communis]AWI79765.1 hypothetical protein CEW87_10515 [Parazoarcus communis]
MNMDSLKRMSETCAGCSAVEPAAELAAPNETTRRRRLKVLVLPDWSEGNPYQNLLVESLQRRGAHLELADFPSGHFALNSAVNRAGKIRVLHLHWINELIAPIFWSKGRFALLAKLALLAADVLVVRLRGIAVIWTIHNLVAHETPNRNTELRARGVLARTCSHVILHSERARQRVEAAYRVKLPEKSTIIPHGNYDGCYPFSLERRAAFLQQLDIDEQSVVVLFFGAIRPYKGVPQLIKAFRQISTRNLRLIVAGRPNSKQFGDEITSLAQDDQRISLLLDFVASEDVAALFSLADVVALPFENTLTSGSVTLALTMGKPLLLPDEARVLDAVTEDCVLFYGSDETLAGTLRTLDKEGLGLMGRSARVLADGTPWGKVAELTEIVYRA